MMRWWSVLHACYIIHLYYWKSFICKLGHEKFRRVKLAWRFGLTRVWIHHTPDLTMSWLDACNNPILAHAGISFSFYVSGNRSVPLKQHGCLISIQICMFPWHTRNPCQKISEKLWRIHWINHVN